MTEFVVPVNIPLEITVKAPTKELAAQYVDGYNYGDVWVRYAKRDWIILTSHPLGDTGPVRLKDVTVSGVQSGPEGISVGCVRDLEWLDNNLKEVGSGAKKS